MKSLERCFYNILEPKLQYFGYLMRRTDSLGKTLMLRKIEGKRRRGWQTMRWLDDKADLVDMNLSKLWETVENRQAWYAAVRVEHNLAIEQQQQLNKLPPNLVA